MQETPTRDRIIAAASRMFAERGYAKTSVADIQIAAGLTGGSGALYKHFSSKESLLRAIVDEHVTHYERDSHLPLDSGTDDLTDLLRHLGRSILTRMAGSVESVRITFRELDQFPELLEILHVRLLRPLYAELAGWLRKQIADGSIRALDPEATAAVLIGSVTYYPIYRILLGEPEAGVDEQRFLDTWVAIGAAALSD